MDQRESFGDSQLLSSSHASSPPSSTISSSLSTPAGLGVPGTMFRVALNHQSPVTLGAPDFAYWYGLGEQLLSPSSTGVTAGSYPATEPDFFVSGYASGADVLKGTAALVDEDLGNGRVILFSGEPDFRAYTDGTAFLLANAITYPLSAAPSAVDVTSSAAAALVAAASASAGPETGPGQAFLIEVPTNQVKAALDAIAPYTTDVTVKRARNSGFLTIPNPEGLDAEQNPLAIELLISAGFLGGFSWGWLSYNRRLPVAALAAPPAARRH